jgi:hypothetical protein
MAGLPPHDKCLDVAGPTDAQYPSGIGRPTEGQPVQLYPCLAQQLNQKWNLTGEIRDWSSGTCLRVGSTGNLSSHANCYEDSLNSVSDWDYYPRTVQW